MNMKNMKECVFMPRVQ